MNVLKIAAGVALGLALAWGGLGGWHYARKEIALQACVAEAGHKDVRVIDVMPCMGRKGWRLDMNSNGADWIDAP